MSIDKRSFISLYGEIQDVEFMRSIISLTKALSDLNRIRVVCALHHCEELCVCQIQELLDLAPSSTSKHLSILLNAGLLEVRKDGRWAFYRITSETDMPKDASIFVKWLYEQSSTEKAILSDNQKLEEILSYTPEELCQRQANGQRCCSSPTKTQATARSR